jgi:hypothetical protein
MKKILSMNWKKSLIAFLLVILIIFPFIDFLRVELVLKISNFPVFSKEIAEFEVQMEKFGPIFGPSTRPLSLKIIGTIEESMLSWPANYVKNLLLTWQI